MADSQPASVLDLSGLMQMLSQFRSGSGAAAPQAPSPAAASPGLDPSALMGMLQNLSAGQQNTPSAPSPGGGTSPSLDPSALMGMLQNLSAGQQNAPSAPSPGGGGTAPGLDPSALMGMLQNLSAGQQNTPSAPAPGGVPPGLDLNLIVQIQKAMQALSASSRNVELLRTLKPHLSEARAKKVDDAIRVMQLIQLLPMLKESGIFGTGRESS